MDTNSEVRDDLRTYIKNGEQRVCDYKVLLKKCYEENRPLWYKEYIRFLKNYEETILKKYRKEIEELNIYLNVC